MNSQFFDKQYNDEVALVDSLYEFHPEYFGALTVSERSVLQDYYAYDSICPTDIFLYRRQQLSNDPSLESRAHRALARLLTVAQIAV